MGYNYFDFCYNRDGYSHYPEYIDKFSDHNMITIILYNHQQFSESNGQRACTWNKIKVLSQTEKWLHKRTSLCKCSPKHTTATYITITINKLTRIFQYSTNHDNHVICLGNNRHRKFSSILGKNLVYPEGERT